MLCLVQLPVMAFSHGLNERMEELRFPNPRSPNEEFPYAGYASPPRAIYGNSLFSSFQSPPNDARSQLHRRFTTDSSKTSVSGFSTQFAPMRSEYSAVVSIFLPNAMILSSSIVLLDLLV